MKKKPQNHNPHNRSGLKKILLPMKLTILIICLSIVQLRANSITLIPSQLLVQQKVTGTVTDEKGITMPGVSIQIEGTSQATITDVSGKFTIELPGESGALIFTFIGYTTQRIVVKGGSTVNVIMIMEAKNLDQVVVVGYGTTTKKEITGSIASVTSAEFVQRNMSSPLGAIQGKVAGLSITSSNGSDPNGDVVLRVRGLNSFSGGQSPLIIVDGTVWEGSLNMINQEQIKTIDILKDGSAAAIYGTRATNGVVLITLKSPEAGKVKFELSSYGSVQSLNKNSFWMSADEYRTAIAKYAPDKKLDKGASTDWFKEVTRMPINQNYNLGITGGRDNISYRANLNYADNEGIFKGNYSKVIAPSIFITQNAFNNRLNLDYKLLYSQTTSTNVPGDLLYQTLTRNPTEPVYDPANILGNGYYDNKIQNSRNPVAMLNEATFDRKINFINGTMNADFKLLENLDVKLSTSYNTWLGFDGQYQTRYYPLLGKKGLAYVGSWQTSSLSIEPNVTYKFNLNNHHRFQVMGGYSYNQGINNSSSLSNGNFDTDKFSYNNIAAGKDIIDGLAQISSLKESNKLIAFYGRATYNFQDKYLASVSMRYEGSSRFGINNKWGTFPALSVGWRLNEENFLKEVKWINDLKIRAGVGVTGNQDIPNYQSIPRLSTGGSLFFYNGQWVNAYVPENNPNPDLKWEKKTEYNVGVDFGLFNRISGTIDLYQRNITDLLWWYNVPVPPNIYNNVYANVGSMSNKGIELTLRGDIVKKTDFSWSSILTYSKNLNKLTKLADPSRGYDLKFLKYTPAATTWGQLLREGDAVGNFWAPIYLGVDDKGKPIYKDVNKDGKVDINSIEDREIVGNDYPTFEMGWQNSVSYKKFYLTFSFRAVVGQSLINWDRLMYENVRPLTTGYNVLSSTMDNPASSDWVYDSRYVDKASYVKLDNLSFGYDFKFGTNNLRLYVSGSNVLTFTNFVGNDPERIIPRINTNVEQFGGTNLTYPTSRTILLGLKFNF